MSNVKIVPVRRNRPVTIPFCRVGVAQPMIVWDTTGTIVGVVVQSGNVR